MTVQPEADPELSRGGVGWGGGGGGALKRFSPIKEPPWIRPLWQLLYFKWETSSLEVQLYHLK